MDSKTKKLMEYITESDHIISGLEKKLSDHQSKISILMKQLKNQKDKNNDLEDQITELANKNTFLSESIKKYEDQLSTNAKNSISIMKENKSLNDALEILQDEIEELKTKNINLNHQKEESIEMEQKYKKELFDILNKTNHEQNHQSEPLLSLFDEIQMIEEGRYDEEETKNMDDDNIRKISSLRDQIRILTTYKNFLVGVNIACLFYIIYDVINFFCHNCINPLFYV